MPERGWSGASRSPEEDIELVYIPREERNITPLRFVVFMALSLVILGAYMYMNRSFAPGYPVITPYAERSGVFSENYPPFRMNEWTCYSITREILDGRLYDEGTLSRQHPVGFSVLSVPLTARWDTAGPYYTNAIVMWLCALVFFFLLLELVPFPMAVAATLALAFATPNIFYAASAFSEPTAQLILLVSLYLFFRGLVSPSMNRYLYAAGGFVAGLALFVQPVVVLVIPVFFGILVMENGRWVFREKTAHFLLGGFAVPALVFLFMNRVFLGSFTEFILTTPYCPYNLSSQDLYGQGGNFIVGFWKLMFDSPHGLMFLMPVVMLAPLGYIVMWRNEIRSLAVLSASVLALVVIVTAAGNCPVTGESVGSRNLVAVTPLLILPLAFLWDEGFGERLWLGATLVLTVYMTTFGWWTGTSRGEGFFIGVLQDRDARMILLARKGMLERPAFTSSQDLAERFFRSLEEHDMEAWLQTLDPGAVSEIHGFERSVFRDLTRKYAIPGYDREQFIQSIDPDKGIRPVIPDLRFETETDPASAGSL